MTAQILMIRLRRLVPVALALAFGLTACGGGGDGGGGSGPPTGPDPNEAPTADLSASPTEGEAPLEVDLELTCTDPDGSVAEYRLDTDGDGSFEITQSTQVNTSETYEEDVRVRGQCVDDDGAQSGEQSESINVIRPTFLRAGQLLDSNTGEGAAGTLRIYDASDTSLVAEITTESDGSYERTRLAEGENFTALIRAILGSNPSQSFVRTVTANTSTGGEVGPDTLTVVRFDEALQNSGWTREGFRNYLCDKEDLDGDDIRGGTFDSHRDKCVTKSVLLENVYITESNPVVDDTTERFSEADQVFIRDVFEDPEDLGAVYGTINVVIGKDEDANPPYAVDDGTINIDAGWLIFMEEDRNTATPIDTNGNGEINKAIIRIKFNPTRVNRSAATKVISHEGLHPYLEGHASKNIARELTVMRRSIGTQTPEKPSVADLEAVHETQRFPPLTDVLDIFGLEF